ncbi:MAG: hypothetical protein AAFO72_12125, partial [Pseudomonadota bacterium]
CGSTEPWHTWPQTETCRHRIGVIDAVATRRATSILHFDVDDPQICHEDGENGQLTFDTREGHLLQHMAWDTMLIHGHVLWSEKAWSHFGDRYKYVTLMREPVARMMSNFAMAQRSGRVTGDLDSYLSSPMARKHAQVYLRYLCGRNDIAPNDVPDALELAKSRLAQFALIGFLDQTETFISAYRDMFGVKLRLPRLNAAKGDRPVPDATKLAQIDALCAPDIALYDAARRLGSAG